MDQLTKNVTVISIDAYKEKTQKKREWIEDFEHGPKPLEGCTCGQHTDPNQFLKEGQVTIHYLKDRRRYVKGLVGADPLENYVEIIKGLMSDKPLVKLNMNTDFAMMEDLTKHFNEVMNFYQEYIKDQKELSDEEISAARSLKSSYKIYKTHMVKSLINSYIIQKRYYISKYSDSVWRKKELLTKEDTLDTYLNESQDYIKFIEDHFKKKDQEIRNHYLSIVAENLERQIDKKLKGIYLSKGEIDRLVDQLEEALDIIEKVKAQNRIRDYKSLKKKYDEEKDDYSIEYKAECLIDLELRFREIDGNEYLGCSGFTANNNIKHLIETIGMERLISKLPTEELENLLEQFRDI